MHPAKTVRNFTQITPDKNPDNRQLSRLTPQNASNSAAGIHLVNFPKQLKFFFAVEEIDEDALLAKLAAGQAHRPKCAANTERAYRADWKDFQSFCRKTNRDSLPALPRTVSLYLMWLESVGRAMATITRRLAAITSEHRRAMQPTPCNCEVGEALAQVRRRLGSAQKPKIPVSPQQLRLMLGEPPCRARAVRDQAILVVGFASGCRRSELAALDLADVSVTPEGLLIRIARSKVDQQGKGREVGVHRGAEICPVQILERWIRERGDWAGPLFCRIPHQVVTRKRLSPESIAAAVKAGAERAGLDPSRYAGHSLRSGCATAAAAAGADILAIARRLGHASTRTTERYVRHGSLFAVNPLKGVL